MSSYMVSDTGTSSVGAITIWGHWASGTSGGTTAVSDSTWTAWNSSPTDTSVTCMVDDMIDVTTESDEVRMEREHVADDMCKAKSEAKAKAVKLLTESLTKKQLDEFSKTKTIPVESPSGNRYRIHHGRAINIDVLDGDGVVSHKLCAHPEARVPNEDTMLAQKLMLELCEDKFLVIANRHVRGEGTLQ